MRWGLSSTGRARGCPARCTRRRGRGASQRREARGADPRTPRLALRGERFSRRATARGPSQRRALGQLSEGLETWVLLPRIRKESQIQRARARAQEWTRVPPLFQLLPLLLQPKMKMMKKKMKMKKKGRLETRLKSPAAVLEAEARRNPSR